VHFLLKDGGSVQVSHCLGIKARPRGKRRKDGLLGWS
jgi:hypothetical protein